MLPGPRDPDYIGCSETTTFKHLYMNKIRAEINKIENRKTIEIIKQNKELDL